MLPKEWGRGFWLVIWIILYDETLFPELDEVKEFLDVITRNLPCEMCQKHISEKIQKNNIMSSNSRNDIIQFFIDVYNQTNSSGKVIK